MSFKLGFLTGFPGPEAKRLAEWLRLHHVTGVLHYRTGATWTVMFERNVRKETK